VGPDHQQPAVLRQPGEGVIDRLGAAGRGRLERGGEDVSLGRRERRGERGGEQRDERGGGEGSSADGRSF
jgi:hypothetical protein